MLNKSLNFLYLLSKKHFIYIIQIICDCFNNQKLPKNIKHYNSIVNFHITCNYLINYKSKDFYLNSLEEHTNEVYYQFSQEEKIKENIFLCII